MIEHLVALIKNKGFDESKREVAITNESVQSTWCGDNDVGCGLLVLDLGNIVLNRGAAVEDLNLDIWQILAESGILISDLESQLTSMTHDDD